MNGTPGVVNVTLPFADITRTSLTEFLANTQGEVRVERWSHGDFLVGDAIPAPVEGLVVE